MPPPPRPPPRPDDPQPQQLAVAVDLLPGPYTEAVAERMLHVVVDELIAIGADVTGVRVEIHGSIGCW